MLANRPLPRPLPAQAPRRARRHTTRQLRRRLSRLPVLLLVTATTALTGATPASAAGDDYPYRTDTSGSSDQWGFTKRQCVSFVAWRLDQRTRGLSAPVQDWGNALQWDESARGQGHRVGSRPVIGAIAHWDAQERSPLYRPGSAKADATMTAGSYGHVGYVRGVYRDGSVSVEHYNGTGDRRYSVSRLKAPRYLYVGVRPPA